MQLFGQSRRAMANYLSFLTGRIFYLNRRIDAYTGGSAECRLAMYLLDNQQDGVPPKVTLPFGMNKLAELLGIGRASLYRAMETLEKKGIVAREGKCIAILKPNDLLHYDGAQGIRRTKQHETDKMAGSADGSGIERFALYGLRRQGKDKSKRGGAQRPYRYRHGAADG
ncbi:MAG: Crp/Fnr family transcriptional regulator [Christensenellales bacterium]